MLEKDLFALGPVSATTLEAKCYGCITYHESSACAQRGHVEHKISRHLELSRPGTRARRACTMKRNCQFCKLQCRLQCLGCVSAGGASGPGRGGILFNSLPNRCKGYRQVSALLFLTGGGQSLACHVPTLRCASIKDGDPAWKAMRAISSSRPSPIRPVDPLEVQTLPATIVLACAIAALGPVCVAESRRATTTHPWLPRFLRLLAPA